MQYFKTIFFFALFSTFSFANGRLNKSEIYIGPSLGFNESMIMFKPTVSQGFLKGYNIGAVFRYIADNNFGLQCELNYSQRGWYEKSSLYSRQLNYIEFPFLTHVFFGNKSRFFFNIGPKISYLLSESKITNNTSTLIEEQHITPIQNAFDYGLCSGVGFLINIKGTVIQLDTRANYGLSDVFSNDKRDFFDTSNNFNLSVNLALLFKVK